MQGRAPLVALVILDGWGCAPPGPGNAVDLADTPVFDRLWAEFPHTTLKASGEAVGLPPGQMGNSEVGHLTIGSGRILYQDLMRVNRAIEDGSFFENDGRSRGAFERGRNVHLLGLVSYGGVHSHIDHLRALLALCAREDVDPCVHRRARRLAARRRPRPRRAARRSGSRRVAGRYYAMDRDQRWERTQRALDAIVAPSPARRWSPSTYVQAQYDAGVTDEFSSPHFAAAPGSSPATR